MSSSGLFLNPSEAARRLGVSVKALRLYEERGLIAPARSAAGWRAYGPGEMKRGAEIATLRALGLSLAEVTCVLKGETLGLEPALAAREVKIEVETRRLAAMLERIRALRAGLTTGEGVMAALSRLQQPSAHAMGVSFELPWPWGGERFELRDIRALTHIIGPLGSGKTRFAKRLAKALPGAAFVPLDRVMNGGTQAQARLDGDPALKGRVDENLAMLIKNGATRSDALIALLTALEAHGPGFLVIDMLEQGLDEPTQKALIARLRGRGCDARPIFVLTRSRAILDLSNMGAGEAIILCPANHSPPMRVAPYPGAPGYEAVATCLASPQVRARTEGVIAWRPRVA
ncbi:MAG: MerR family transcriptional regulator [Hyphomicrobiales bacterium]|nr:MerR family transcriptional regulator [Hyphomicrobiales bacterium]